MPSRPYPTAKDSGFALSLTTNLGTVSGGSAAEFLLNTLEFLERHDLLSVISIPFSTSGNNYLLSFEDEHPNGRKFFSYKEYEFRGSIIFINTNHPRFFALRQGARLLNAAGLELVD